MKTWVHKILHVGIGRGVGSYLPTQNSIARPSGMHGGVVRQGTCMQHLIIYEAMHAFLNNKIQSASPLLPPGLEPATFIKQTEGRRPIPSCPFIYKGHTGRPREQRSHPPPTAHLAHFTVLWGCKHNRLYSLPIILHTGV